MSRSAAHDARNKSFREAFATPFEYKANALPTAQVITEEAQSLNLAHSIEEVPAGGGARIHWLGNSSAHKVLLYFHGKVSQRFVEMKSKADKSKVVDFASPP